MAQTSKRTVQKSFFDVKAPLISAKITLYAATAEELNGKVVRLDLTRNLRGKSIEMKMKIVNNGGELIAEPVKLELVGSYIRRMVRKGTDYVEDSFKVDCKDAKIVIKPFMITRNKVSRAIRNSLRVEARKHLESHLTTRTAKELFSELLSNKIQKDLSLKLKKIYPLALCEIRIFELVFEKK